MRIVPYIALLNSRMIGPMPSPAAVASSCHHKAAIAAKSDHQPVGMNQLGGDRGGDAIAHRTAGRAELAAGPAVLQKAVGPAAEIAGIRRDDRVVGQALAQPADDP